MNESTFDDRMTRVETTLWGAYGNNGINSRVTTHDRQIGELYDRDEGLRREINQRFEALNARLLSLTVAVAGGAIAIVGAVLATQIH